MKALLVILVGLLAVAGSVAAAAAIFSPLKLFSTLVPVDGSVERVAESLAYGPDARQRLDVYRPAGGGAGLPVLVFCYGGAWDSGDRQNYDFVGRTFAAQGYLTIVFDYRLVPETRYPGFVEDTAAAVAWASRHAGDYGGDPSRVFLVGHSAGAYNVAMVALEPRFLSAHGLSPSLIAGVAGLAGPYDFLPLDDPATIAAFSAYPDLARTQPVNLVTEESPPFLLLTGDADTTVGPYHSRNLAQRLDEARVPNGLILYPSLQHADVLTALSRPLRWRAPVLEDIIRFFGELQAASNRSRIAS